MRAEGSVHFMPTEERSLFLSLRERFSRLACGCFGRTVRSYDTANSNNSNSAISTYIPQLHDFFSNSSDRIVKIFVTAQNSNGERMQTSLRLSKQGEKPDENHVPHVENEQLQIFDRPISMHESPIYPWVGCAPPVPDSKPLPSVPDSKPLLPPISDRQPLTGNAFVDSYFSRSTNQVLMPESFIDRDYSPPLGQPSPDSVSPDQHRYRSVTPALRQKNSLDQSTGTNCLCSSGQSSPITSASNSVSPKRLLVTQANPVPKTAGSGSHPISRTEQLFVNTAFQVPHSSCPTTPVIRSSVQTGSGDLDLPLLQENPGLTNSLGSQSSQIDLDKSFLNTELVRRFSLHEDIVVGTGKFTENMGGVVETRYIPDDVLCVAKPVKNNQAGQNEVNVLSTIRHPNMANIVGTFFDDSGQLYVAMENGGKNLKELLEGSQTDCGLDPEDIKMIITQLLIVGDYLEGKGIIHSDLKPDNLLYKDGWLKVCDFGLARGVGEAPPMPVLVLAYMPPEALGFQDDRLVFNTGADNVDIWSIGCMLAELVTGRKLFEFFTEHTQLIAMDDDLTLLGMAARIQLAAGEIKNFLGDEISKLFTDMMQLDPTERITASEALQRPCIVSLINNLPKAPDTAFSVNGLPQQIQRINQQLQHQYAGLPSAGDSSDSNNVVSINDYQQVCTCTELVISVL